MPIPDHDVTNDVTEDRFRTIGEVSAQTGIKPHVLRYWEENFPMLRPLKRAGGRRYYRVEDVALILHIDELLHKKGLTLAGARAELTGQSHGGASSSAKLSADARAKLTAVRENLAETLAKLQERG